MLDVSEDRDFQVYSMFVYELWAPCSYTLCIGCYLISYGEFLLIHTVPLKVNIILARVLSSM